MATKRETMGEVSQKLAGFTPVPVVLLDGRTVSVGKMSWLQFDAMLAAVGGILATLAMQQMDATGDLYESIVSKLASVPAVLVELVALTTGLSQDEVKQFTYYEDVLALANAAITVNFIDTRHLRDFFVRVRQGFLSESSEDSASAAGSKENRSSEPSTKS